jgi:hypothetical protein
MPRCRRPKPCCKSLADRSMISAIPSFCAPFPTSQSLHEWVDRWLEQQTAENLASTLFHANVPSHTTSETSPGDGLATASYWWCTALDRVWVLTAIARSSFATQPQVFKVPRQKRGLSTCYDGSHALPVARILQLHT